MPGWLLSWALAAALIWPLQRIERWIHRHIQGLGLLVTNNAQAATLIYYILMLPGVVLHEVSQWLLAKLLRVTVKKFQLWPDKKSKDIRLGLVEIDKKTDDVRASLVGMIPLATGVAAVILISNRFDASMLLEGLRTGDLPTFFQGIRLFTSATDFWVWVYLLFAIANAMFPEEHDRINWWLPAGVFAAFIAFLVILDLGVILKAWVEGPVAIIGRWLSIALLITLLLDLFVMGLVALLEAIFERITGNEVIYKW